MASAYDIIGDVHGQAGALAALLWQMGYHERDGAWRHPDRQVIFTGDFIDRGPKQVETVTIVRRMMDAGSALAVMGNHDFNAIAWYLPDPARPGDFLRSHSPGRNGKKYRQQHAKFLGEVEAHPSLHREIVGWLLSLPLWLDLPELRVVHACWHERFMEYLTPRLLAGARLSAELMQAATQEPASENELDSPEPSLFKAVGMLLKGLEVGLPGDRRFTDRSGLPRSRARVRWWASGPAAYREVILLEDSLRKELPEIPIPVQLPTGQIDGKPLFFGHYSLSGTPRPLLPQVACVDYGAGHHGPLTAYRWDGETVLAANNFCWVQT
jgi:hypothetical protein